MKDAEFASTFKKCKDPSTQSPPKFAKSRDFKGGTGCEQKQNCVREEDAITSVKE